MSTFAATVKTTVSGFLARLSKNKGLPSLPSEGSFYCRGECPSTSDERYKKNIVSLPSFEEMPYPDPTATQSPASSVDTLDFYPLSYTLSGCGTTTLPTADSEEEFTIPASYIAQTFYSRKYLPMQTTQPILPTLKKAVSSAEEPLNRDIPNRHDERYVDEIVSVENLYGKESYHSQAVASCTPSPAKSTPITSHSASSKRRNMGNHPASKPNTSHT